MSKFNNVLYGVGLVLIGLAFSPASQASGVFYRTYPVIVAPTVVSWPSVHVVPVFQSIYHTHASCTTWCW